MNKRGYAFVVLVIFWVSVLNVSAGGSYQVYLPLLLGDGEPLPTATPAKKLATYAPSSTPYPTYTPMPTYTPYPTHTSVPTATPTERACAATVGYWRDGWLEFWVTDRCRIKDFTVYVTAEGCGNWWIKHLVDEPINDSSFNFQGSYMANGTFIDSTHCKGRVNIQNFYLPGCGWVSGKIWDYTASWNRKRSTVPESLELERAEPGIIHRK